MHNQTFNLPALSRIKVPILKRELSFLNISDDGLPSGLDMDMLNRYFLMPFPSMLIQ